MLDDARWLQRVDTGELHVVVGLLPHFCKHFSDERRAARWPADQHKTPRSRHSYPFGWCGRWQGSSRRSTTSTKLKAARARRWRNVPRCCAQVAGGGACAAQRTAQPRAPRCGRRHHAARGTAGDRSTRPAPPRSRPHPAPGAVQRRGGSTTAKTRVAVCRCFTICTDGTETEARPVRAEKQKRPE